MHGSMHKIVFSCDGGEAAAAARIFRLGGGDGSFPLDIVGEGGAPTNVTTVRVTPGKGGSFIVISLGHHA